MYTIAPVRITNTLFVILGQVLRCEKNMKPYIHTTFVCSNFTETECDCDFGLYQYILFDVWFKEISHTDIVWSSFISDLRKESAIKGAVPDRNMLFDADNLIM